MVPGRATDEFAPVAGDRVNMVGVDEQPFCVVFGLLWGVADLLGDDGGIEALAERVPGLGVDVNRTQPFAIEVRQVHRLECRDCRGNAPVPTHQRFGRIVWARRRHRLVDVDRAPRGESMPAREPVLQAWQSEQLVL